MKILIIGGTVFLGRHLTDIALNHGHDLTHFNRGNNILDFSPEVTTIKGDRDGDLHLLKNQKWDAVIDTCGYYPRVVKDAIEQLKNSTDNYTFISTMSVYQDYSTIGIDENYPVGKIEDEASEEVTGSTYGPLKALCEKTILDTIPEKALIIRPGLIVGPNDQSDRFSYWTFKVSLGGQILAPGNPEAKVQFIDVRDLSEWIINLIENKQTGIFNATGPEKPLTMQDFLFECKKVSGSKAEFLWVDDETLMEFDVAPYSELPLWVPVIEESQGFSELSIKKALSNNLKFRPLKETILDTLNWFNLRPYDYEISAGIDPELEKEIMEYFIAKVNIKK